MSRPTYDRGSEGLHDLDPVHDRGHDAAPFRRILAAREGLAAADRELRAAVLAAREAGYSWAIIGSALDTSRQAAQQRFGSG